MTEHKLCITLYTLTISRCVHPVCDLQERLNQCDRTQVMYHVIYIDNQPLCPSCVLSTGDAQSV